MNFSRECILRIGVPGSLVLSKEITCTGNDGLRITFEVRKQLLGFPNTAIIQVYNLSETTRNLLHLKGMRVELWAGYSTGDQVTATSRLFLGDVINIWDTRENPDTVTTIWARDGGLAYDNATMSMTFAKGTSLKQLLAESVVSLKKVLVDVVKGTDQTTPVTITSPLSFTGSTKDFLDQLGKTYQFNWFITDGQLNTIPTNQANMFIPQVIISRTTGMIGSPTITEIGADVDCLLNPSLLPAGVIKILSVAAKVSLGDLLFRPINRTLGEGNYRINEVVHTGDTRGNEWKSHVIGYRIDA